MEDKEWVSVKDRLPKCGDSVALVNIHKYENCAFVEDRKLHDVGYLAGPDDVEPSYNNWWAVRGQRAQAIDRYTHWMPLPPPPKPTEGGNMNDRELIELAAKVTERSGLLCRYEYPEDRFVFWRWNNALGPNCKDRYWHFDEQREVLTLELLNGEKKMCYALTQAEMNCARFGWRWTVAQALWMIRKALRHNQRNGNHRRKP